MLTELPLVSIRSALADWFTGKAAVLTCMVGILVRVALAIVFGSMPLFTMVLFRTPTLLTATVLA